MALIGTLQEDFEFGGIDSGKWTGSSGRVVVGTDLDLQISSLAGGAYDSLDNITTYDLTGSSIFIQLTDAGNQSIASWEVYPLQLKLDGSNNIRILITGNTIQVAKTVATVAANVGSSVAYNSSTTKWFRISESGGTITFAYAADPTGSWTTITTLANPFAITALQPQVICGTWQVEGSTTTAKFDNINVTPGSLQFTWKGYTWNKRVHAGPAANNQTWSPANITTPDSNNYITLSLTNAAGNAPIGCEIFSAQRGFGYGTYTAVVGTRMDNMHAAIGYGNLFTFDFTAPPAYKEIDIGEVRPYLGQSTKRFLRNHTYDSGGIQWVTDDMPYPSTAVQTHRMIWTATKIIFEAYHGSGDTKSLYSQVIHDTNIPTAGLERVHFNIFVDTSVSGYANATPIDVVIRDFSFSTQTQYNQNISLASAEHDWFASRSGAPANVSTDSHKRAYFVSKGIAGSVAGRPKPLMQMENEWLDTLTGVTSKRYADKWLQAVAGAGKTPTQRLSENKSIFFTQVTTSP